MSSELGSSQRFENAIEKSSIQKRGMRLLSHKRTGFRELAEVDGKW